MPPRARVRKPEPEPDVAKHAKADGEICAECWPAGWPTEDTYNASCIHGTWFSR
jgi:hypothetical protein